MSMRAKVLLGLGLYLAIIIGVVVALGSSGRDLEFAPQNEFKLSPLFHVGSLGVNKAHLYILAAGLLTAGTMLWISRRMRQRPNKVQTVVELACSMMRDNITRGNMPDSMSARWFPFVATLFLFIWFSNMLGYLPLPTNIEHKVDIFGLKIPAFALYAATANLSVPLVLTIAVFFVYNGVGVAKKGPVGYLKGLIPPGVPTFLKGPIFVLEIMSNFMRLLSLSVRLFANILAGHLIILFMGGALAVLLGVAAVGVVSFPLAVALFLFEIVIVATLQAFIFATLTAIYIGGAAAESH